MQPGRPLINALNRPHWQAAEAGRLALPHCERTGRAFWPPSPLSPFDGSAGVVWREVEPLGVIVAEVAYRRSYSEAFEKSMPYAIGLVELDAGPRWHVFLGGADAPLRPRPGCRVRIAFERMPAGQSVIAVAHREDMT